MLTQTEYHNAMVVLQNHRDRVSERERQLMEQAVSHFSTGGMAIENGAIATTRAATERVRKEIIGC